MSQPVGPPVEHTAICPSCGPTSGPPDGYCARCRRQTDGTVVEWGSGTTLLNVPVTLVELDMLITGKDHVLFIAVPDDDGIARTVVALRLARE